MFKKYSINFVNLSIIQGGSLFYPFIAYPYLYKTLANSDFSDIVLAEAYCLYIIAFALYSYDVIGVKLITDLNIKNNLDKVIDKYYEILLFRFLILLIIGIISIVITYLIKPELTIYIAIGLFYPAGMILQANYFFQAIEDNKILAYSITSIRALSCLVIFTFIKNENEGLLAAFIIFFGYFISGLISWLYVMIKYRSNGGFIRKINIKKMAGEGFHLFFGNLFVGMIRGAGTPLLGAIGSEASVAIYSVSERIIKSIQAISRPICQVATPSYYRLVNECNSMDKIKNVTFRFLKIQMYIMSIILIIALSILVISDYVGYDINIIILIMSPAVIFGLGNMIIGTIGYQVIGIEKKYSKIIVTAGITSILVSLVLIIIFDKFGAGIGYVFGEFLLYIMLYYGFKNIKK
jgi:PST family polysaccharide transporter